MPHPNKNYALLTIEQKVFETITTESGFQLYLAPEWNFEHNVSVTGTIAELPENYTGPLIQGDEVAFSYRVISERELPPTSEYFVEVSEGSPHIHLWANGKGEKLRKMAHQGAISLIWTGTYFNKHGQFEHGCQGTEREVDRWLHQWKFDKPEEFSYTNRINYNGHEYWKCPLEDIFAKKVGDGIVAIGDRVICEPIDIPIGERITDDNGILLPDGAVKARLYDRATVVSGGKNIGILNGQLVSFADKYVELYELFGKKYFVIRERRVEGIWLDEKSYLN